MKMIILQNLNGYTINVRFRRIDGAQKHVWDQIRRLEVRRHWTIERGRIDWRGGLLSARRWQNKSAVFRGASGEKKMEKYQIFH